MEKKSKLTGVPIEILDQVFRSGCAAWRTGHRPGAVEAQWGHARVNSFLVKGKTFYTADKYLVDKIMTSDDKSYKKAQEWFRWVDGLCDERDGYTNPEFCQKSNLLNLYKK